MTATYADDESCIVIKTKNNKWYYLAGVLCSSTPSKTIIKVMWTPSREQAWVFFSRDYANLVVKHHKIKKVMIFDQKSPELRFLKQ